MKNKNSWFIFGTVFVLIAGLALLRTLAQARKDRPAQDNREQQEQESKTTSGVFVRNGETVIRLSAEDQSQAGIETESL